MKKNIGGRPKKNLAQKKSYRITIKMDTQQYYSLKASSKSSNMTMTECARELISNGYVKERFSVEHLSLMRKLSGMANNLNQIAKQANISGFYTIKDEYLNLAATIASLINEFADDR